MTPIDDDGNDIRDPRHPARQASPPPNEGRPWDGINRFEIQIVATLDVVPTVDEGPQ